MFSECPQDLFNVPICVDAEICRTRCGLACYFGKRGCILYADLAATKVKGLFLRTFFNHFHAAYISIEFDYRFHFGSADNDVIEALNVHIHSLHSGVTVDKSA